MNNIWQMAVKSVLIGLLCITLSACAVVRVETPNRIGLLAPFEGRYREIGYNALYAARLAITESGREDVELLALDDGGSIKTARERAHALVDDPKVMAVVVLGYAASEVHDSFDDIPVVIVGDWHITPQVDTVFILSSPNLDTELLEVTEAARVNAPYTGGEVFALEGFRALRNDLSDITIVSSGSLPDDAFTQRYLASDPFAVEPGLLTTLTYDAVGLTLSAVRDSRSNTVEALRNIDYEGINGNIRFDVSSYWLDAPINTYKYNAGELITER